MSVLNLDLSGIAGLVSKFQGDLNSTVATPNKRYLGKEGQYADGIYDPVKNYGYLSPSNNTFATITGSLNANLVATEYDSINDDVYFAEAGAVIWKLDGLNDTSLSAAVTLTYGGTETLNDLEIYEIYGTRCLFYSVTVEGDSNSNGQIGYVGLDANSGVYWLDNADSDALTEAIIGAGTTTKLAQSYDPPTTISFDRVRIALTRDIPNDNGGYTIKITVQDDNGSNEPDGSVDATGTFLATVVTAQGNNYQDVYVDLDAQVTKSGKFWIVVEPTVFGDMGANDMFFWRGDNDNAIADGTARRYTSSAWADVGANQDFSLSLIQKRSSTWFQFLAAGGVGMSKTADIFMKTADNGFMYVFEDNKVHKVDGTVTAGGTGTITAEVLRFPSYFKCVDAVDTRGRMYIAVQGNPIAGSSDGRSYSEGQVGVYVWDRQSTVVGVRDFVPLYGVRDIKKIYVDPNGDVRVICIGDDKFTQVRSIASGAGKIIRQLGLSAYPETRDSLKVVNNMTVWLGADGTIYSLGQITYDSVEELYKIGTMIAQATGAFTTGAIFVGDSTAGTSRQAILVGFQDTVTKHLKRWYPHGQGTIDTVAQLGGQGDVYTLLNYLPGLSKITNIHLVMNRGTVTGTGTDIVGTVKLYLNQATSSPLTYNVTKNDVAEGFINLPVGKTSIFAFQMEFEWQTTAALGDGDFCPVLAQVYYEPTTKRM